MADNIKEILKKKEVSLDEFLEIVRGEAWMEDTSFEDVPGEDGGINIEEHVWSMNAEHVRVLVRIDREGFITETGDLTNVELLKEHRVRVI